MSNAPEQNPEDEIEIGRKLDLEHIRPAYIFQGKELWPYNKGMKLIYNQIVGENDTNLFRWVLFIWILVKRGEPTFKADAAKHLMGLAFDNINAARAEIVEFCGTLSDEEELEAKRIMEEWIEADKKSRIKAGPADGKEATALKKTELTPAPLRGKGKR